MSTEELSQPQLVRRFTSELKDDSDLAIQTKAFQEDMDKQIEIREKMRMDHVSDKGKIKEQSVGGLEIARQALQSQCEEFFKSIEQKDEADKKKSSVRRMFHRNSTEQKLAQEMRNRGQFTVDQVSSMATELEEQWNESNSKVATNFMKICQKLNDHKQIFQCFPSQSDYTSALCGAVTMIVQASINYATIAETLSGYVAELSDRISICTNWLDLYTNVDMKERLCGIYEQYFKFFTKVATWYMKPKSSKIFDSFNSNFTTSYQGTKTKIQTSIQLLREQGEIENARQVTNIMPALAYSAASIIKEVKEARNANNDVGGKMYQLLLQLDGRLERLESTQLPRLHETSGDTSSETSSIEGYEPTEVLRITGGISRAEAEELCQSLDLQSLINQVGGSDGIEPARQAGRLVAEPNIIHTLGRWTQSTCGNDLILWIMSPYEPGPQTSAELAAYGVIWTAIQAKAQFVAYTCHRPRPGAVPGYQNLEGKAAVLAMAYSLILQLLQFQPPGDELFLQREMIDQLTQPGERWTSSLALLKHLLANTPTLRYFIVSGINLLESEAQEMCEEFVDLLLSHVRNADSPLRILFTTSGQSRTLFDTVSIESKVSSQNTFRRAKGRRLYHDVEMPS
ncbi:uncharacterized protein N7483_007279 [Penicillium malachiteum]|uniref:uncharacterized protein n=1 Tax=Penicillium malachiteum TaxID=1324776 RepID=UPI0025482D10|nr:uncharacterized protein N7483_007279 [Penicillium malachiteum]KAJ5725922.1 hypothetical protein N7483_007279 [Penicillium malachiteum]